MSEGTCDLPHFAQSEVYILRPHRTCNKEKDGDLCYSEMEWVQVWLNKEEIKKELGAAKQVEFKNCNMEMNQAFAMQARFCYMESFDWNLSDLNLS
jgi:hypothetical protein